MYYKKISKHTIDFLTENQKVPRVLGRGSDGSENIPMLW